MAWLPNLRVKNSFPNIRRSNALPNIRLAMGEVARVVSSTGSGGTPIGLLLTLTYSSGTLVRSTTGKGPNIHIKNA